MGSAMTGITALAQFAAGETAMTIIDTNDLEAFKASYPDLVFTVALFPRGNGGTVSVLDCSFVCITTKADRDVAPVIGIPASLLLSHTILYNGGNTRHKRL